LRLRSTGINSDWWLRVSLLRSIGLWCRVRLLRSGVFGLWCLIWVGSVRLLLRVWGCWVRGRGSVIGCRVLCRSVKLCWRLESSDVDISRVLILGSRFIGLDVGSESGGIRGVFNGSVQSIGVYVRVRSFSISVRVLFLVSILFVSITIINLISELIRLRCILRLFKYKSIRTWTVKIFNRLPHCKQGQHSCLLEVHMTEMLRLRRPESQIGLKSVDQTCYENKRANGIRS
jgi:hypothetical protein